MTSPSRIYMPATAQPDAAPLDLKTEWLDHLAKAS
jgi:hypothetical protein